MKTHRQEPSSEKPLVHIYSDGSCSPNPGAGGWGVVLIARDHGDQRRELSGAVPESTNNRMELTAAIEGLRALKRPCRVVLHTDSRYMHDAFDAGWIQKWKRNGWKTSAKKDVSNRDLWEELDRLCALHEVRWQWVKAHANDVENNRVDELANAAREQLGHR